MAYEEYLPKDIANVYVKRNNKYQKVVNLLVYGDSEDGIRNKEKQIFHHIKDLVVFAAMVGKKLNLREAIEKENTGITIATFAGSSNTSNSRKDLHNIVFLFGLTEFKDMKYLRDENIHEAVKVFEEYSNGGLSQIEAWLIESKWNPMVLLDKVMDVVSELKEFKGIDVPDNPF